MKKNKNARKKGRFSVAVNCICVALLFLGFLCVFSARWYIQVYGDMGFASVIYTLTVNLGGVQSDLVMEYLKGGFLPAVIVTVVVCAVLYWQPPHHRMVMTLWNKLRLQLYPFGKRLRSVLAVLMSLVLILYAALVVKLPEYISDVVNQTALYETVYVDPANANIKFPEKKKNLIYIVLESMETSFFSQAEGGGLAYNCIPELYQLAAENINFSLNESVGGFAPSNRSTWTIASLVSQTAGLPLVTPPGITGNKYGVETAEFLPGATTLTDILHENGYYQTLMVGSESSFGGRQTYFSSHNMDKIYDLYTAREDGLIPEDYYVWWGFEDSYLYEYAKQELTEISKMDQPFAFTMLTVDTHHIGGYLCSLCGTDHAEQYENVYACASKQLVSFVDWLRQQDFWEDTTVIICGDHPSMDQAYIDRAIAPDTPRLMYNCFINSSVEPVQSKNRVAVTLDMFPTTLAAMGCTIEGDRLALGTNLFSATPTLAEEMGLDVFNSELGRSSTFYLTNLF